ncbi:MAG: hypothetical protein ACTHNQ_18035 [Microbacterium sp.]
MDEHGLPSSDLVLVPISDIEPATIVLCSLRHSPNPMVRTFRETTQELSR